MLREPPKGPGHGADPEGDPNTNYREPAVPHAVVADAVLVMGRGARWVPVSGLGAKSIPQTTS